MEKKGQMKVYTRVITGDIETPVTVFKKYVGDKVGLLLESRDNKKGRYSFIAKNPFRRLKSYGDEYELDGEKIKKDGKKFMEIVEGYIKEYPLEDEESVYIGGAYGTIGYDMVREYEKLLDENPDNIGTPDSDLMFFKEGIVFDHFHQNLIFTVIEESDREGKLKADVKFMEMEKTLENDLDMKLDPKKERGLEGGLKGNITKEEFMKNVEKAQKYIYEGDVFQVVLSQRWEMETREKSFDLYRKLRITNPSPYLFYINFGDYQIAGSSPEMLVEVKGNKIYTCPIAGTRRRGTSPEEDRILAEDLINDEKEAAEHVMLVDLARNDVGKVSKIDSVEVTQFMKVQNYSHVMHLVSLVEGEKKEKETNFSVLSSILPAGTLSGAPKVRAMEIIEELEKNRRGIYGGAVGYFSYGGNMDTCIAIRTMVIKNEKVYLQAGAGITGDSVPENEYEECRNKIGALVSALNS
ncbi:MULTISPECIES: anthranilate synthase component I [Psychrilyobacter]|uniref:Anthranilate synthase component 1 n=1 Tax=Psychrilyobacter piezotolerans TaxID=2293438 RepID=A0ABX9KKR7_9FUSO|nr:MULTISPECIES: anthranilate synthase component I [Psychrilyobacter]MCS5420990.1 anthranilate synthase component I [Psychrilyobacter sp. S5]NDI76726.1 anthranilate synthase component I [Psychrilyobacter piezotolerans]RDE65347.1 anthranilate synthase component I [Psychrilyobacter sp. S5]REI42965.1 anthranilate synthase component I [Psychrilyobacter piezotolerans]